ncbi:MAG: GAF domain-containing protein [Ignavibacteria bacterium]|nr:GAF domain-containing protein [Ignavibacteria bacterium]
MRLHELLNQNKIAGTTSASKEDVAAQDPHIPRGGQLQDLETVLSVIRKINTSLVLSDVLALVIDHAIRITSAQRGFLMLSNKEGHLEYVVGRDKNGNVIDSDKFQVSGTVLEDVYTTGESICIESALNDERFEQRQSIINLELQMIMCAPLQTHEATIGVIYVDSRYIHSVNRDDILRLFEILAGQAAIAITNARLYEDLKKTYEELKNANEHIIKSERMAMRGELAAEVSHELKNIINIALFQTQNIQRTMRRGEMETSEKTLKDLIDTIRRINNFSDNLLVRTSINSQCVPLELNGFVNNFAFFIKHLPKFRNGKIVVEVDPEVPEVSADSDQIQQVLLNLVNNAIEACAEATITLRTEYDFINNAARLIVADNGPGLDPRVKEKLFIEKVTTKPNGHGFGLPVCRKIVQNHKGEIIVESQQGQGTKFIITIPVSSPS